MPMSERKIIDLEEGWDFMLKGITKLKNILEGLPEPQFNSEDYMMLYTNIYTMCTQKPPHDYSQQLYDKYVEQFEELIVSTVNPSLQGKKDELLLTELLKRWSDYKIMIEWLSRIFSFLESQFILRRRLPSLEETSFVFFNELVLSKINIQVGDAILAMIDRERAGEQIDRILVNDTLAMYSEIGDSLRKNDAKNFIERMIKEHEAFYNDETSNWITSSSSRDNTLKEEELHASLTPSSKKIKLISSDGDEIEVDYSVALMSKTIEYAIKTNPAGGTDNIPVSIVSSNILAKVIEYCKKHTEASSSNHKEHMSGVDIKDWDSKFVQVDYQTLFDLVLCANYLNIKSLLDLTCGTIADMIKGKSPEEMRQMFNNKAFQ